jgi:hypothetical protein
MENFKVKSGVDVDGSFDSYVPVGAVIPIMFTTLPEGWLKCDGSSFSSNTYPALAQVLGNRYGTSSGTTYYLPNLNDRYPYIVTGTANATTGSKLTNTSSNNTSSVGLDHGHNTGNTGENHQHNWGNYHNKSGPSNLSMNSGPINASGQGHFHGVNVSGATSGVYAWHAHGTNSVAGSPGANTTEMSRLVNGHSHTSTHGHGDWQITNMKVYYIIKS